MIPIESISPPITSVADFAARGMGLWARCTVCTRDGIVYFQDLIKRRPWIFVWSLEELLAHMTCRSHEAFPCPGRGGRDLKVITYISPYDRIPPPLDIDETWWRFADPETRAEMVRCAAPPRPAVMAAKSC